MAGVSARARLCAFSALVLLAGLAAPVVAMTASRTITVGANVVASCTIAQETIVRVMQQPAFVAPRCEVSAPLSTIAAPAPRTLLTNTRAGGRRLTLEF